MRIRSIRALEGPNVHAYRSVLLMQLDLEALTDRDTREFAGFDDRLIALLPGLHEHVCGTGRAGGFIERLCGGTFFGHVVEHVALELSSVAGAPVNFGRTRVTADRRVYDVVVEYTCAPLMRFLLHAAVEIVGSLAEGREFTALEERLAEARRVLDRAALGPSTRAIVDAARRRGIPVTRLNEDSLVQLGYGKHLRLIEATVASTTSAIGVSIAADKQLTRELLDRALLPVPRGGIARTEDDAIRLFAEIDGRAVVKPLDGSQGRSVAVDLNTPSQVADAFRGALEISKAAVVEEMLHGRDYRLLVVGGRFAAASERLPAEVVGDGGRTVEQLVEHANRDPRRGESHEKPLTRITIDEGARELLNEQHLLSGDVPPPGVHVRLRHTANLSTGGTARDVTDAVHPDTIVIAERAARVVGLDICGIDLIAPDISSPLPKRGAGIIEVNSGPGIRMHHHPSEGAPRDVGTAIVNMLYPAPATGRIPIAAITGTNGKTTVARMLAHAFAATSRTVGLTTTDGVYIGGRAVACGDMTGPRSARAVLADPAVEVAVLETARGGIVRSGLGFDWCDVAVVTNIQADHLGQDGIRTIDDLVHIKSLVPERVREGGTIVLNGDDECSAGLADNERIRRIRREIVLFSLQARQPRVEQHLHWGGTAYFPRNGWIVEARGAVRQAVCRLASIPCTFGGAAQFNLSNALAAVAAGRAMGLDSAVLAASLGSFAPERENPGRANLYAVRDGYLLVDYGHNAAAIAAVAGMLRRWRGRRLTGILGLPGDRMEAVTCEAVEAAAHAFDRIIVREDHDLRGRAAGEMPAVILREVRRIRGTDCPCTIIPDQRQALKTALDTMERSELVVLFYDEFEELREILAGVGATPMPGGLASLHTRARVGAAAHHHVVADRRHSPRALQTQ